MTYWPIVIGSVIGISVCAINVISMEGVVRRPDINGNLHFTPENLIEYMKLPFDPEKKDVAWPMTSEISLKEKMKLLSLNWVAMAGIGAGVGAVLL